jgi:hypothetical protein
LADSGFAGTMMSQLTLAAVVVVAGVELVDDGDGLVLAPDEGAAEGLAELPRAPSLTLSECPPPERTTTAPIPSPSAAGMAKITAVRAARFLPRLRHADRRLVDIRSTSMSPMTLPEAR